MDSRMHTDPSAGIGSLETHGEPRSTDEARRNIEAARGRISATLGQIEERIEETKEHIKEKADVLRPVRERVQTRPWPSVGIALGTGVALGLLTGGSKSKKSSRNGRTPIEDITDEDREDLRKWRAQRRERLRSRMERQNDSRGRKKNGSGSTIKQLRKMAMKQLTGAIGGAITAAISDAMHQRQEKAQGGSGRQIYEHS